MERCTTKDLRRVMANIKRHVKNVGITRVDKNCAENCFSFDFDCMGINLVGDIDYNYHGDMVKTTIHYINFSDTVNSRYYKLVNDINVDLLHGHHVVVDQRRIDFLHVYPLKDKVIDQERFEDILKYMFGKAVSILPLLYREKVRENAQSLITDEKDFFRPQIQEHILSLIKGNPDGEIPVEEFYPEPPYQFHDATTIMRPNYTDGLTALGMPEFLIDCMAFGNEANRFKVKWSYMYLRSAQAGSLLQDLKHGRIITLDWKEVFPNFLMPAYQLGFRRISADSEMAKKAYGENAAILSNPDAWFVQIYLVGDDHSLTEEYYREGIEWWRKRL